MINIIAEIGINHNGDIDVAFDMITKAKNAGATHVKFQKRNPDVCVPEDQKSKPKSTPWGQMTYLEYKQLMEFTKEQYMRIDEHCKKLDIEWFASIWDVDSINFIADNFNHAIVKIPSAKATDMTLLTLCKEKFKTVIVSTGMCTLQEIENIVQLFNDDKEKLVLLHCVSAYPAGLDQLHMDTLDYLKQFGFDIGYSSHETEFIPAVASVYKGIKWLERHFTSDKTMWGTDQSASSTPDEFQHIVEGIRLLEKSLGKRTDVLECEKDNLKKMR